MTKPPIIPPTVATDKVLDPLGRVGYWLSTKSASAGFKVAQEITVTLKGRVFIAVLSVDVWSAEISAVGQIRAELPDSDYTFFADFSDFNDYPSLTLNAISVGNNAGITLTLNGQIAAQGFQEKLPSSLAILQTPSYNKSSDAVLAEKGHTWIEHPNNNLSRKRVNNSLHGSAGCMVIPSNTVLNLRALVTAFDRLSTQQIEKGVQELIDLLDYRTGDSDLEVDVDFEPEIEEESACLI